MSAARLRPHPTLHPIECQSFMSSKRPDRFGVWNFIDAVPLNTTNLPGYFRDVGGYTTYGMGKLWHEDNGAWNAPNAWTPVSEGGLPYFNYTGGHCPHGGEGGGHCVQEDDQIYDYHLMNFTTYAVRHAAEQSRASDKPFFIGSGFRKPHAPWQAPQRMYDLYQSTTLATATVDTWPTSSPLIGWSHQLTVELENGTKFQYDPFNAVPDWVQQDQRHAYYSACSYTDENIGKVLAALEAEGLSDSTIVLFHADHGYSLSEHGYWEKKSNSDIVVRVPMLVHVPWDTPSDGEVTQALAELVDVFPTLASLAGLPPPPGVDGADLSPLLKEPKATVKNASYHQYPACDVARFNATRGACNNTPRDKFDYMSYSIRTPEWRYTTWLEWDKTNLVPKWDGPFAAELYSHAGDDGTAATKSLDAFENENLAKAQPDVAAQLHAQVIAFFKGDQRNA